MLAAIAATSILLVATTFARADCADLLIQMDHAVSTKSIEAAKSIEKRVYLDDVCSSKDDKIKERIVALEADLLADPSTPVATRVVILADLRNPAGWLHSWSTAALAADRLFSQHHFSEATDLYDKAIALAGDPTSMSDQQKSEILEKASAAARQARRQCVCSLSRPPLPS